jgi:hypothetical protein
MSTTLYEDGDLAISSFAGGVGRGPSVQIDNGAVRNGMVQLTRTQAETTVNVLAKWLGLEVSRGKERT